MINKLRYRFISIMMASVLVVLAVIIAVVNISNYASVRKNAENLIDVIIENGGSMPMNGDDFSQDDGNKDFNEETPYETRYFTVLTDSQSYFVRANLNQIASISASDAAAYAKKIIKSNRKSGMTDSYFFKVKNLATGYKMIVFVDCTRSINNYYDFLYLSILISVLAYLVIFLLVIVASKRAVAPMYENYKKQKQFITDAGHELKTPLTIIDANTEIIEMDYGESEWTQSIKNQVKRLAGLTENLIFLSRMDEENVKLNMTPFSISDAVREACGEFVPLFKANGNDYQTEIEDGITVKGDKNSIKRLVSIFLDNAEKYTNKNGTVKVTLKSDSKNVQLSVFNTVDEIAEGDHSELFGRFYRRDESRNSKTGGSGIGLSAAKAIVTAHGGKIEAFSPDTKSIIFKVTLKTFQK